MAYKPSQGLTGLLLLWFSTISLFPSPDLTNFGRNCGLSDRNESLKCFASTRCRSFSSSSSTAVNNSCASYHQLINKYYHEETNTSLHFHHSLWKSLGTLLTSFSLVEEMLLSAALKLSDLSILETRIRSLSHIHIRTLPFNPFNNMTAKESAREYFFNDTKWAKNEGDEDIAWRMEFMKQVLPIFTRPLGTNFCLTSPFPRENETHELQDIPKHTDKVIADRENS